MIAERPTILLGYDGSEDARDGLVLGAVLARLLDAEIHLVSVFAYGPIGAIADDLAGSAIEKDMRGLLAEAIELVGDGVDIVARPSGGGSPARAINDLAEDEEPALIVLGSPRHGRVGRALLGSVTRRLLSGAPCPVAVAPRGYADRERDGRFPALRTIGVAYDGSREAGCALKLARDLALEAKANLSLAAVIEPEPPPPPTSALAVIFDEDGEDIISRIERERREAAQRALENARSSLPARLQAETHLLSGNPGDAIAAWAARDVDLLCAGSRSYGPLRRVLAGSTSSHLTQEAPCPVLISPRGSVGHDRPPEGRPPRLHARASALV